MKAEERRQRVIEDLKVFYNEKEIDIIREINKTSYALMLLLGEK